MQLNKLNQPAFTAITNYSTSADGSIQARYIVGTGIEHETDGVQNFQLLAEQWKHINAEKAQELLDLPLTAEDVGKKPNDIMLSRIYNHLKEIGEIIV